MCRQGFAVETIEQCGQTDQIAVHPFEQPVDGCVIKLQAATLRSHTQHIGTTDVVQRLLPAGVEVDTFDGSAWVGLVPFHMDALGIATLTP